MDTYEVNLVGKWSTKATRHPEVWLSDIQHMLSQARLQVRDLDVEVTRYKGYGWDGNRSNRYHATSGGTFELTIDVPAKSKAAAIDTAFRSVKEALTGNEQGARRAPICYRPHLTLVR